MQDYLVCIVGSCAGTIHLSTMTFYFFRANKWWDPKETQFTGPFDQALVRIPRFLCLLSLLLHVSFGMVMLAVVCSANNCCSMNGSIRSRNLLLHQRAHQRASAMNGFGTAPTRSCTTYDSSSSSGCTSFFRSLQRLSACGFCWACFSSPRGLLLLVTI